MQFDPNEFANAGSPVPLPEIIDFPGIGHLTCTELKPLAQALNGADLSVLADRRVAQSVAEMRDWIQFCAEVDRDLVTFYT